VLTVLVAVCQEEKLRGSKADDELHHAVGMLPQDMLFRLLNVLTRFSFRMF